LNFLDAFSSNSNGSIAAWQHDIQWRGRGKQANPGGLATEN
jgi:hypothetical protein